jgi:hypothetical protein
VRDAKVALLPVAATISPEGHAAPETVKQSNFGSFPTAQSTGNIRDRNALGDCFTASAAARPRSLVYCYAQTVSAFRQKRRGVHFLRRAPLRLPVAAQIGLERARRRVPNNPNNPNATLESSSAHRAPDIAPFRATVNA